jgi:hypothetical protein
VFRSFPSFAFSYIPNSGGMRLSGDKMPGPLKEIAVARRILVAEHRSDFEMRRIKNAFKIAVAFARFFASLLGLSGDAGRGKRP